MVTSWFLQCKLQDVIKLPTQDPKLPNPSEIY
jgi:hypothetical protein